MTMKKPPLYDVVDALYHMVADRLPEPIQRKAVATANVLGMAGTYLVVRRLHQFVDEKHLIVGLVGVPIAYAAARPRRVMSIIKEHPVYTSGVGGCVEGGLLALL